MNRSTRTVILSAALAIVASSSAVLASPPAAIPEDCDLCVDSCEELYFTCNAACPPEHQWAADACPLSGCSGGKQRLICIAVGPD